MGVTKQEIDRPIRHGIPQNAYRNSRNFKTPPRCSKMFESEKRESTSYWMFSTSEMRLAATKPEDSVILVIVSKTNRDIQEIPKATPVFSTMPMSNEGVSTPYCKFSTPEMEMAATTPEVSVVLVT